MQLERTASCAAVGLASGIMDKAIAPVALGGQSFSGGTLAEAAALVVGIGMQQFSRFTMPNIVDGVVDGAIALLARRGGIYAAGAMNLTAGGAAGGTFPYALPFRTAPMSFGASASPMGLGNGSYAHRVSPAIGGLRGGPRLQIT